MAITGDILLDQIGNDIYERILSDAYLQYVPVLRRDRGDIDNQIENALKGNQLRNDAVEKGGCFIAIQLLDVAGISGDAPMPLMDIRPVIECSENILVNQGAYGTGVSVAQMVGRLTQLLHGMHLEDIGTGLRLAPQNAVRTLAVPVGQRGYEMEFQIDSACFDRVSDCAPVTIAVDGGGEVTLTTTTSGATIYYTTDGSYPGSGNANATAYSAPFSPGAVTVRAAAEKTDLNPSKFISSTTLT